MITPGQEALAWAGAFLTIIALAIFWPDEDAPKPKRKRQAVPRMFIQDKPYKDDRDSLVKFRDIECRRDQR